MSELKTKFEKKFTSHRLTVPSFLKTTFSGDNLITSLDKPNPSTNRTSFSNDMIALSMKAVNKLICKLLLLQ